MLNEKLSKLLDMRRSREAEALKSLSADHSFEIKRKEALHRDELNMKDTAHRRYLAINCKFVPRALVY